MGLRSKNTTTTRKLGIHKETLRSLQARTLDAEQLKAVVGGWNTGCCDGPPGAPSFKGC